MNDFQRDLNLTKIHDNHKFLASTPRTIREAGLSYDEPQHHNYHITLILMVFVILFLLVI